ncbi:MAG: hypothetical protein FWC16_05025 [Defluviitaleaceae bacterium]|nr:hypothetical protein [Defluviitaleaceae bacterium]MCL2274270.1 hypothetical protein [Defluviitaleaceae bacterium]
MQKLIEDEFEIDEKNSSDKQDDMKENKVGYLSVHYIAKIKPHKVSERDVGNYKDMVLEIQIRTLLQHSWAVVNHAYNYKLSKKLPPEMVRRFNLIAGTLELIDQNFQQLLSDVESYTKQVDEDTKQGNFENEIDSVSLHAYLSQRLDEYSSIKKSFAGNDDSSVEKLNKHGIKTIKDLDSEISQQIGEIDEIQPGDFSKFIDFLLASKDPDTSYDEKSVNGSSAKKAPFHFHRSCIEKIELHLKTHFDKVKTTTYFNEEKNIGLTCAVSKNYSTFENALFWFAFHQSQSNFLKNYKTSYAAFACGNSNTIFLIDYSTLESYLDQLSTSRGENENRKYWHIKIRKREDKYFMLTKGNAEEIDITNHKI